MQYYINRAEPKTTQSGKQLKKLELAQEGKQYPIKNVTIWSDHPLFAQAAAGANLEFEIYETDSGVPNPNAPGKNYMNKTVANPNKQSVPTQSTPQGTQTANVSEMAIKMHVTQEIAPLKEALKAIVAHLGIEAPKPTVGNTSVPYPENEGYDDREVPDISEEDIPF